MNIVSLIIISMIVTCIMARLYLAYGLIMLFALLIPVILSEIMLKMAQMKGKLLRIPAYNDSYYLYTLKF